MPRTERTKTFRAVPESLPSMAALAEQVAADAGAWPAEKHEVVGAVIEAASNAVLHAYPGRTDGEITLSFHLRARELVIEVVDTGCGFDTGTRPRPQFDTHEAITRSRGRGLFLLEKLLSSAVIESEPGLGVRVHMVKKLGGSHDLF